MEPSVWQAPLVPAALAFTIGIVLDRYWSIPPFWGLVALAGGFLGWIVTVRRRIDRALLGLALGTVALGALRHHWYVHSFPADDIGRFATSRARPANVRGFLVDEPAVVWQPPADPLRSMAAQEHTTAILAATELHIGTDWQRVSGRAQLVVAGQLQELHAGDEVEIVGRLVTPRGPANPGEFDYAAHLRDRQIRAELLVVKTPQAVTRLERGWTQSLSGWLAIVSGWAQRTLTTALPRQESGVAVALLLGQGSTMTNEDWQKYIRTGVIHVLAISGQHLAVLAMFFWWMVRVGGWRRRRAALIIAGFLVLYALMAGGRPPVLRSAVMVLVAAGALHMRRPLVTASSFALSWIAVAVLQPTDLFDAGCQMSFLSVAVLYWGTSRYVRPTVSPIERLIDETRPGWLRQLRRAAGSLPRVTWSRRSFGWHWHLSWLLVTT